MMGKSLEIPRRLYGVVYAPAAVVAAAAAAVSVVVALLLLVLLGADGLKYGYDLGTMNSVSCCCCCY